ncbi:MAG: class I SAM-dependent methyltransferase, partial [Bacteroidota bacterium]
MSFRAIDLSGAMCQLAKNSIQRNAIKSCVVTQGDALETDMESESADAVVSTFGLKTFSESQLRTLA